MNRRHLARDAVTVYEALEDAGLTAAAINITCYRGRTRSPADAAGSDVPGRTARSASSSTTCSSRIRPVLRSRSSDGRTGSIDGYAAAVGRWLVTRDGFDFLVYYLPDYDFASHAHGPDGAFEALDAQRRSGRRAPRRRRRAATSSSTVTRSSSAPTTGRRASNGRRSCSRRSATCGARSSPRRTARGWSTGYGAARTTRARLPSASTASLLRRPCSSVEGDDVVARRDGEERRSSAGR